MKNTKCFTVTYMGIMASIISLSLISCARNDDGYLRENNIDPAQLPVPDFTASETTIDQDATITFTDTSTNSPSLYTWSFDGGNPTTSTEASPTIEYPIAGTFTVSLKVRNDFGAAEVIKEGFITVERVGEPLDPAIAVRLNFENGLLNEGSAGGAGVSVGSESYGEALVGEASYDFSGSNAVNLSEYTGINGNNPRTVATWVKTTTTSRITIAHWGASGTGSRATFAVNTDGTVRSEFQGGGLNSTMPVNDGEWHHVAYTYDGTTLTTYVDGIPDTSLETTIIDTGNAGETNVEVGAQFGARFFTGNMDDFRIYDVALTAGEIGALASLTANTVNLGFEANLDNTNVLGIPNATTAGVANYSEGIVGGASYLFDGAGNALSIPGYTGVNGANPRTIMAWLRTTTDTRITIAHWGASGTGSRATFAVNADGTIRSEFQGGGLNSTMTVNDGEWHHVAYGYDGATLTLYVDGMPDTSLETSIIDTGNAGETDVEVGSQFDSRVFNGNMDDFRIFNRALSPETISVFAER
ncbi:MAG: LamG-like jellyroll fold domain-containing protein [Bacteroidota bacterium]